MPATTSPFERLGQALLWLRKRHGLTQAGLAKDARISAPHLSRIENGQVQPILPTLEKILVAMDADLAVLSVAIRAVEDPIKGSYKPPSYLPLDEQEALLLAATGFQAFLTAASARLAVDPT